MPPDAAARILAGVGAVWGFMAALVWGFATERIDGRSALAWLLGAMAMMAVWFVYLEVRRWTR